MSEAAAELAAALAGDEPSPFAMVATVTQVETLRTNAGVITAAGRVWVQIGGRSIDCDWLELLNDRARAGRLKEGAQVVLLMMGARPVILDLFVKGANPVAV
ncbi:hypothetical protein FDO65_10140 [Nakamurella flava]|uniref:OB-fold nucleic acid binding domain-containing protein n=1 Tax=Nakamurella flava TaxID=2576308 RepID=A0A4U6QML1_9ACTN|nr:hypothetical protein [Nakamurella flava]TKV61874.1 hypothetical protein FDO65_10140 [Nakamurella flava]